MVVEAYAMKKKRRRRWRPILKDFEIRAQLRMEEGFLKIGDFDFFFFFLRNDNFTPYILFKKTHKTKDKTGIFFH